MKNSLHNLLSALEPVGPANRSPLGCSQLYNRLAATSSRKNQAALVAAKPLAFELETPAGVRRAARTSMPPDVPGLHLSSNGLPAATWAFKLLGALEQGFV
jgi:hypothetical protein